MSSSLRDELVAVISAFVEESEKMAMPKLTESRRLKLADRILALPAIAEGQRLFEQQVTAINDLVNHSIHITKGGERIAPEDFYKPIEDHPSISTHSEDR